MSDPLYELLSPHLPSVLTENTISNARRTDLSIKYLSRLLSLRVADLTTTEPQSLSQAEHSNHVSIQALSSRSHRTTTFSAQHLSTLQSSLPSLTRGINEIREAIPALDNTAVSFASTYARSRDVENPTLQARKDSMLIARQSDKLTDILELPALLSTAIASAGSGAAGGANYSQALDLFTHIKRLSIIYPDSELVKSVQVDAEEAMKSMTTNLLASLRSQNIRLAAAIRTVGWLRRIVPELSNHSQLILPASVSTMTDTPGLSASSAMLSGSVMTQPSISIDGKITATIKAAAQTEGSFGALFLVSRLHTFLSMTEALTPLRDLADQETERRLTSDSTSHKAVSIEQHPSKSITRRISAANTTTPSTTTTTSPSITHGTQTERYLKRYIEIFREQSFNTISMYRNIFPDTTSNTEPQPQPQPPSQPHGEDLPLRERHSHPSLPSALLQFPLHIVEILMDVLRTYLPNVTDAVARESLLMQVLYAANSLGRLGADFSMMISLLDEETYSSVYDNSGNTQDAGVKETPQPPSNDEEFVNDPEWARVIQKHRVQAARLDALSATGQNSNQTDPRHAVDAVVVR